MTNVRVRVPMPKKEKMKRRAINSAQDKESPWKTPKDFLLSYIKSMKEEIEKQNLEVQKAQKRKQKYSECIKLAHE